eukprot:Skav219440  [mRNA]  locus=scaffold1461:135481:149182:+ [translate_table: standard]
MTHILCAKRHTGYAHEVQTGPHKLRAQSASCATEAMHIKCEPCHTGYAHKVQTAPQRLRTQSANCATRAAHTKCKLCHRGYAHKARTVPQGLRTQSANCATKATRTKCKLSHTGYAHKVRTAPQRLRAQSANCATKATRTKRELCHKGYAHKVQTVLHRLRTQSANCATEAMHTKCEVCHTGYAHKVQTEPHRLRAQSANCATKATRTKRELRDLQLRNATDQSSSMATLEQVRKGLASVSQEVEISREMVVKRADVTALSQTMQNAWELMTQTKAAINKVDFSPLHADVQRVLEELRETRAELPKIMRGIEVDFTPIMRGLQDRKRIDEATAPRPFSSSTVYTVYSSGAGAARLACKGSTAISVISDRPGATVWLLRLLPETVSPVLLLQQTVKEFCKLQEELAAAPGIALLVLQEVKGVKEMQPDGPQDKVRAELQGVVQDLRLVTTNLVDSIRHEVMKVDLAPLMTEIKDIRSKATLCPCGSVQLFKAQSSAALEVAKSDILDAHIGIVSASAVNTLLQNLLEQRQRENETTAEDFDFLRRKLRDTQSVIGQVGSRHDELRGRVATGRPPEHPVEMRQPQAQQEPVTRMEPRAMPPLEPVTQVHEPVAPMEPRATPFEPVTPDCSAHKDSREKA